MNSGLNNKITFAHNEKKFMLHHLMPTQVLDNQVQMKQKREIEREKLIKSKNRD